MGYDRDHLFWSIQALRFLDPESFANEIDMIEHSGGTATIRLTEGPSSYDYDTDTVWWNPVSAAGASDAQSPNHRPWQNDSLTDLAHGLNDAWHDLCRNGDGADLDQGGTTGVNGRESHPAHSVLEGPDLFANPP